MKVKFIIGILFLSLFSMTGYAQRQFQRQYQKQLRSSLETNSTLGKFYVGVSVGCPWSRLSITNLNETSNRGHVGYLVGLHAEHFFKNFSVGLNASLTQRGTKMKNKQEYQISLNQNGLMDKTMTIVYDVAAIRIPFSYYLNGVTSNKRVIPYLFVMPELDLPMPFSIHGKGNSWIPSIQTPMIETTSIIDQGQATVVSETAHPKMDVGVAVGAGLLFLVHSEGSSMLVKLNAGINACFLDQASDALKEKEISVFSQNLELSATVMFRLKKPLRDAGYYFSRSGYY